MVTIKISLMSPKTRAIISDKEQKTVNTLKETMKKESNTNAKLVHYDDLPSRLSYYFIIPDDISDYYYLGHYPLTAFLFAHLSYVLYTVLAFRYFLIHLSLVPACEGSKGSKIKVSPLKVYFLLTTSVHS